MADVRIRGKVREVPPPGQLVDIGGYRLHAMTEGAGSPPVVMEAGTWDLGLTWSLVQPDVAAFAATLTYDRAGLGWSDPSPGPRTAEVMADELRALLRALGLEPPYVLVAQSFGGLVSRLYAYHYPQEVAGMVLVDAAHEDQLLRFPPAVREAQPTLYRMQIEHLRGLRGQLAEGTPVDAALLGLPQKLPEDVIASYRAVAASSPSRVDTMIAELEALEESQAQVRAARDGGIGDLPLVVLSHGEASPLPPIVRGGQQTADAYEEAWQQMQAELSGLSSHGRHVLAEGSVHMIHHDRPDLVIGAIRDVVESARGEADR